MGLIDCQGLDCIFVVGLATWVFEREVTGIQTESVFVRVLL
jgi:hypothetical protein